MCVRLCVHCAWALPFMPFYICQFYYSIFVCVCFSLRSFVRYVGFLPALPTQLHLFQLRRRNFHVHIEHTASAYATSYAAHTTQSDRHTHVTQWKRKRRAPSAHAYAKLSLPENKHEQPQGKNKNNKIRRHTDGEETMQFYGRE